MGIVRRNEEPSEYPERRRYSRDLEGLKAALNDEDPATRRWSARELAAYKEASDVLVQRLKVEKDPYVWQAIMVSLVEIGDEVAVRGLIDCLRSDDAKLRNDAIEALKQMPDAVAPVIRALLKDDDSDVRIFAVNVLESLKHPNVEDWLIDVVTNDPHVNVCATAADLLTEVGTEKAIEPLIKLKERFDGEPYIAFVVDLALRRIKGE